MTAPSRTRPSAPSGQSRRRPGLSTRLRGLAAAVILVATTIGIPLALATAAGPPVPRHVPSLTAGDDGSFAIGLLLAIAWLAWAAYVAVCVVEAVALARHRPARRLPGLRWMHDAAAGLLATAALALPAVTQPAFAVGSAQSVVAAAPAAAHSVAYPEEPHNTATPHQAAAPDAQTVANGHRLYTVPEPTDGVHATLWSISARELGDPLRWKQIYQLNRGRLQPDGERFTNPNLIKPGWQLHLPTVHDSASPRQQHEPPRPSTHAHVAPAAPPPRVPPVAPHSADAPAETATTDHTPSGQRPAGDSAAQDGDGSPRTGIDSSHDALPWLAVGGAVIAAALLGLLRQWRAYQRHHRRRGERVVPPSQAARDAERRLRLAANPDTVATVTDALRALTACAAETGAWPPVAGVEVAGDDIHVHLSGPFALPADAPFHRLADGTSYRFHPGKPIDPDTPPLLPALVTVGERDGRQLLVDVETLPPTRIDGEADAVTALLRHIATELVTAPWTTPVAVTVAGMPAPLVSLNPTRLRTVDVIDDAFVTALESRAYQGDDLDRLRDRTDQEYCDIAVHIVILGPNARLSDPAIGRRLLAAAETRSVTVLAADGDLPAAHTFALDGNGTLHVPVLDRSVTAVSLPDEFAAALGALVESAQDLTPTPPAATVLGDLTAPPDPQADANHTDADAALPPTTAEVEDEKQDEAVTPAAAMSPTDELTERVHLYLSYDETIPRVGVLGEVMVNGVGPIESKRLGVATELIAYLATHPRGVSAVELDSALWPDHPRSPSRRSKYLSYARSWLGTTADGQDRIPRVDTHPRIQLNDDVLCDWTLFQQLVARARQTEDLDARSSDLELALQLVRGQPFAFLPPRRYAWLADDQLEEEIAAAVGDVAHELAELLLQTGQPESARDAIRIGQSVDRYNEGLWALRLRVDHALGGAMKVRASVVEMESTLEVADIGDLSPVLAEVIGDLLPRHGQRAG